MSIKPGNLTLPQAAQLNDLLAFADGLINSAGTGDLAFSVGTGGITANIQSPVIQVVQVVNAEPSTDLRFDAQIVTYNELTNTYSTSGEQGTSPIWLREANSNILTSGEYYVALGTGYNPDYIASGGLYGDARSVYTTSTTGDTVDIQVQVLTTQVNTSGSLEVSSGKFVTASGWYSGVIQSYLSGQYQSGRLASGDSYVWYVDNNGRTPVSGWIYNVVVVDTDSSGVLVCAADTWELPLQVQVISTVPNTSGCLFTYIVSSGSSSGLTSGVYTSGWYSGLIQSYISGQYQFVQTSGTGSGQYQSGFQAAYCWWLDTNGKAPLSGWIYNSILVGHDVSGVPICTAETWQQSGNIFADLISLPQAYITLGSINGQSPLFADLYTLPQAEIISVQQTQPLFADLITLPQAEIVAVQRTQPLFADLITLPQTDVIISPYGGSQPIFADLITLPQAEIILNPLQSGGITSGYLATSGLWAVQSGTIASGAFIIVGQSGVFVVTQPTDNILQLQLQSGSITSGYLADAVVSGTVASGAFLIVGQSGILVTQNSDNTFTLGTNIVTTSGGGSSGLGSGSIQSGMITLYAVNSGNINSGAVTVGDISSGAVTSGSLGQNAITSGTIGSGAFTITYNSATNLQTTWVNGGPQISIGPGGLTSGSYGGGSIQSGALGSGAIQFQANTGMSVTETTANGFTIQFTAIGLVHNLY